MDVSSGCEEVQDVSGDCEDDADVTGDCEAVEDAEVSTGGEDTKVSTGGEAADVSTDGVEAEVTGNCEESDIREENAIVELSIWWIGVADATVPLELRHKTATRITAPSIIHRMLNDTNSQLLAQYANALCHVVRALNYGV